MEQVTYRNGEKVIRIQDKGGRIMIEKTKKGYVFMSADEIGDKIFIPYRDMVLEYLTLWDEEAELQVNSTRECSL